MARWSRSFVFASTPVALGTYSKKPYDPGILISPATLLKPTFFIANGHGINRSFSLCFAGLLGTVAHLGTISLLGYRARCIENDLKVRPVCGVCILGKTLAFEG